ncbi:hypothetical protein AB4455_02910 [Vibrio sp. 10N.261.46.E12]|uniref:Uncharacterized protein n=1 Tax=Vibrio splendidus TaxID=29497 RepID=A0A2N7M884_VIBSP|nr:MULTISPECIES: hypothetical protein [Vibrio]PMF17756.1 hypothetical protein BCV19_17725 [Vibrio splendidus]PML86098.1 hypothetical protein BCT66_14745 [Vibrio sp. 10N.261.49.E11]PMN75427.1 hypothetical protein BCT25_22290 [Vibrio sp. 10N.261.45.A6]PMN82323.1 hypothetical protein BCT22_13645 [Vibrio sp. 10N.261.45.A1]PMO15608.1 hypothetical protein BCT15_24725 [Vibrio splendidus]
MTQLMVTVTLAGGQKIDCDVSKHHYRNNKQIAIQLCTADTKRNEASDSFPGEPMGTPTVCLPNNHFNENETAIKDCDEYAGFLGALEQAGVVRRTTRTIHGPYVSYHVVEVLI